MRGTRGADRVRRRLGAAVTWTVVALLATAVVAHAAPTVGGQAGGDAGNTKLGSGDGPAAPGLRWVTTLEDTGTDAHRVLVDGRGHVLVQTRESATGTPLLVHLQTFTSGVGTTDVRVVAETPDIAIACTPVVTDAGILFAQLDPGSPASPGSSFVAPLVGIDTADGSLVPGLRFDGPADGEVGRIGVCADSLRMAPDGTLLVVEHADDQGNETGGTADLHAFDVAGPDGVLGTADDAFVPLWRRTLEGVLSRQGSPRPAVAADGEHVYVLHRTGTAPVSLAVDQLALVDGTSVATGVVPGDRAFVPGAGSQDGGLVATPTGVLVLTQDTSVGQGLSHLAHLSRVNGALVEDWVVTFDGREDDPAVPGMIKNVAVDAVHGQVVGFSGRRHVVAVALDDGTVRWVTPDLGDSNTNDDEIALDRAGNAHVATNNSAAVVSFGPDGAFRWSTAPPEELLGIDDAAALTTLGPVTGDGALLVMSTDGDGDPVVAAIGAGVQRLSGPSREATATRISGAGYLDGQAGAVVLARRDDFADALAGTPFAAQIDAPLLLTRPSALDPTTEAEIRRVLPAGGTVWMLGGTNALQPAVATRLATLGYLPRRISGPTRFETAVEIAERMTGVTSAFLTFGFNFPDALAAGPAAIVEGGVVLLTRDRAPHPTTEAFLAANPTLARFAVGGPGADAHPSATPVRGATRERTAILVAERFFDAPPVAGFARRDDFADALTGGGHVGRRGGPILLTSRSALHPDVRDWIVDTPSLQGAFVYGGTSAFAEDVRTTIAALVS